MPTLDAFDEEFGRKPVDILRGPRRKRLRFSTLISAVLGAAIITVLALPWVSTDERLRSEVQAILPLPPILSEERPDGQIDRLGRQIDALKNEIAELTEVRQQMAHKIASLEVAAQQPRGHSSSPHWYSDLGALNYRITSQPSPNIAAPPSRRSARERTAGRTDGRDIRRRERSAPQSPGAPAAAGPGPWS
jgi:hypothetical protein